jgi:hypothetical protein
VTPEINPTCALMTKEHVNGITQPAVTFCRWVLWKMQMVVQGVTVQTSSANELGSGQCGC